MDNGISFKNFEHLDINSSFYMNGRLHHKISESQAKEWGTTESFALDPKYRVEVRNKKYKTPAGVDDTKGQSRTNTINNNAQYDYVDVMMDRKIQHHMP